MRIGIDASRATVARRTGTESYSLNLIRALIALGGEDDLTLYFRNPPAAGQFPAAPRLQLRVIPFPRLWTHLRLSWEMARRPPDVLFVPAHSLPLYAPRASVVTVHDLGYLHYPETHSVSQRMYLEWSTSFSARSAARIIADSQATKQDLIQMYQLPPEKIVVVYPGRDESLQPVRDEAALARLRQKYNLPQSYLLHVGTIQPRKNLLRLVEAFHLLVSNSNSELTLAPDAGYSPRSGADHGPRSGAEWGWDAGGMQNAESSILHSAFRTTAPASVAGVPHSPLGLVLAGRQGWLSQPILDRVRALGLDDRVRVLDYVADEDLAALYSAAELYVFPSLYEGFGFTPLEAMACGTPVVCSRASSLPEVVGDAARLVDPHDVPALAAAMAEMLARPDLRAEMVERGFRQSTKFSWARCAQETLAILREAALERR